VLNSGLEKHDHTMRNIVEAIQDKGLACDVDGCGLFWFLIKDNNDVDHYLILNEVEAAFETEWFESEQSRTRGYVGAKYYDDACDEIAASLARKDQTRTIQYSLLPHVRAANRALPGSLTAHPCGTRPLDPCRLPRCSSAPLGKPQPLNPRCLGGLAWADVDHPGTYPLVA
jgi:hypothetical protein